MAVQLPLNLLKVMFFFQCRIKLHEKICNQNVFPDQTAINLNTKACTNNISLIQTVYTVAVLLGNTRLHS